MAELEKVGVPTVAFVARSFEKDWQASAKVFGVKELPWVTVPRPFVGLDAEDIHPHVDAAFDALVKMLTEPMAQKVAEEERVHPAEVIAIEGEDRYDALERMNRMFLDQGWGSVLRYFPDGLLAVQEAPGRLAARADERAAEMQREYEERRRHHELVSQPGSFLGDRQAVSAVQRCQCPVTCPIGPSRSGR